MTRYNKKSITLLGAGLLAGSLMFGSCTTGFESINDPKHSLSAEQLAIDNYNITAYITQIANVSFPEQENSYQMNYDLIGNYLGRYLTYTVAGWNSANFANFNAPDGWARYPFRDVRPKVESAMTEIIRLASVSSDYKEDLNYNWALILRAHAFLYLTDLYGPMPLNIDTEKPGMYNSQETIYKALLADLDAAISYIQKTNPGNLNLNSDAIYGGDMNKWLRMANSLKLRMAIRMRFVEPELAKKVAEEAVASGVIESNADNAKRTFAAGSGLWKTSVDWGDSRLCADLDVYMNGYSDPRLAKYFKPVADASQDRSYIGLPAASNVGSKDIAVSLYSAVNRTREDAGIWMTAAEMYFCRAEGALVGWNMGGTAEELYTKGVNTSFEQWGASGASAYLASTATPAAYTDASGGYGIGQPAPSNITPQWSNADTDEVKLQRIITQKWIALFPQGHEAWCDIRRTGYPVVYNIQTSTNGYALKVPNRIPFDTEEKVNNPEGYASGVAALGGADNYGTKMWWQKK